MAQIHGKAGAATYRKGDRLMFRALFPTLMMGVLTYFLFRSGLQTTGFLGAGAGCVVVALGFWCVRDVALSSLIDTIVGRALSLSPEDIRRHAGCLEGLDITVASRPARELQGALRVSRAVALAGAGHPGLVRIVLRERSR